MALSTNITTGQAGHAGLHNAERAAINDIAAKFGVDGKLLASALPDTGVVDETELADALGAAGLSDAQAAAVAAAIAGLTTGVSSVDGHTGAVSLSGTYERGVSITSAGAKTSAADNTTVIQGLIDDLYAAGGGTVFVPRGTWRTGQLKMRTGVALLGENRDAARLVAVAGINTHLIVLASGQMERVTLAQLTLDGNKAQQTAGDAIFLDNTGSNSNRLNACKAWLAGRLDQSQGTGYVVSGVSRTDLIGCESQDNRQHGFGFITTRNLNVSGCRADRNGLGPTAAGGVGDAMYAQNVTDSRIDMVIGDRNEGGLKQRWAYNCAGTNSGNIVSIAIGALQGSIPGNGSWGLDSSVRITWNDRVLNAAGLHEGYGTAAPTTGTYAVGDTVWNTAPAAGGAPGWKCTTAGTPGTWKAMANLAT